MSDKRFNGKAIYNPSGKAGEYSYWACNFYTGCSNGCTYCYCRRGVMSHVWSDKPQLKKCFKDEDEALSIFEKELLVNLGELQKYGLFFSFTTDPMLPETRNLTVKAIEICNHHFVKVKILTKCTDWVDNCNLPTCNMNSGRKIFFPYYYGRKSIAFGFTLTGHDELEIGASMNAERIETMKKLHEAGFKTFASIEPIVDFGSSLDMIEKTLGFCDLYKVGLMSGKKYNIVEAQTFVEKLIELPGEPKIYLKESLQKLTGYNIGELLSNFVDRDYNMFNLP